MMRADSLNWQDYGCYTEMTAESSNVYSTVEDKSKRIIMHETLSHNCSANKDESKQSIVNKTLSQNYSVDVEKLCSMDIDKLSYSFREQKDEGNEVTYDVPNFNVSNIYECRRNNPDVSYERKYMVTSDNEYFLDILDHLEIYQDCHGQRLSSKTL